MRSQWLVRYGLQHPRGLLNLTGAHETRKKLLDLQDGNMRSVCSTRGEENKILAAYMTGRGMFVLTSSTFSGNALCANAISGTVSVIRAQSVKARSQVNSSTLRQRGQ